MAFSREAQTNYPDCWSSAGHTELWFDIAAAALRARCCSCPQLSLCQARDTAVPAHTRPRELIWLKINLVKSSKANQTFCGQVSILSTAVWFSVQSRTRVRQSKEGTTGTGARFAQNRPHIFFILQQSPSSEEYNWPLQRCSSSCSTPGAALDWPPPQPRQLLLQSWLQWQ